MSRKDLTSEKCMEILEREQTGFLAMCRDDMPYCIPLNYFFDREQQKIYIHTGLKGLKWDILAHNPSVCFTVADPGCKRTGDSPCTYTYEFESVAVFGKAAEVEAKSEVSLSLNKLVEKYRDTETSPVPEEKLSVVRMVRIDIERITGRHNRPV